MAQLSEKELLLLSNLMYCPNGVTEGDTVAEIVNNIETAIKNGKTPRIDGGLSKEEFLEIIDYIKHDEKLMKLTVTDTTPKYSDVRAACFVDPEGNATVAFEGTGGTKIAWETNFKGEYVSDSITQREAAMFINEVGEKYDNITVTGHSKGGNMAMYSAIICHGVANCVSFDGQGFSSDFYEKYQDKVNANSYKITNICGEDDFINPALRSPVQNKYLPNPVEGLIQKHYPNLLFKNNFNGDYGDFDGYVEQTGWAKFENYVVEGISVLLHLLPEKEHELVVDIIAILATKGLASNDYSLSEAFYDFGVALQKYTGKISAYTNAEYTINLSMIDECTEELGGWADELAALADGLDGIYSGLKPTSPSLHVNKFLLGKAVDSVQDMSNKTTKLAQGLYAAEKTYSYVELRLSDLAQEL